MNLRGVVVTGWFLFIRVKLFISSTQRFFFHTGWPFNYKMYNNVGYSLFKHVFYAKYTGVREIMDQPLPRWAKV